MHSQLTSPALAATATLPVKRPRGRPRKVVGVVPVLPPVYEGHYVCYIAAITQGNPGPAGWGFVVVKDGAVVQEAQGSLGLQSAGFTQITAACAALTRTPAYSNVELRMVQPFPADCLRPQGTQITSPVAHKRLLSLSAERNVSIQPAEPHDTNLARAIAMADDAIKAALHDGRFAEPDSEREAELEEALA